MIQLIVPSSGSSNGAGNPAPSISTRLIAYVETDGNDATGVIGNPALPFQTIAGALTAISNSPDYHCIQLGAGTFVHGTAHWSDTAFLRGRGAGRNGTAWLTHLTVAGLSSGGSEFHSDGSLTFAISGNGTSPQESGWAGGDGPSIKCFSCHISSVVSTGGQGAPGQSAPIGSDSSGDAGGNAGNGGQIVLVDCVANDVFSQAGVAGTGGSGDGIGLPGLDGAPGLGGEVTLVNSRVNTLSCDTLRWQNSSINSNNVVNGIINDAGGNATGGDFYL